MITLRGGACGRLGTALAYAKGTDILGDSEADLPKRSRLPGNADVAMLALGEKRAEMTGEAASRTELDLPGNQQALLEAVAATGKPVVLAGVQRQAAGARPGRRRGRRNPGGLVPRGGGGSGAGANALRGQQSERPADREFPARGWAGAALLQSAQHRQAMAGPARRDATGGAAKYKSRYIDQLNTPLYLFGFGLSYTSFAYGPVRVERLRYAAADLEAGTARIKVTAKITNSGARAGAEVVQLYINQRGTSVARPVRELKGFRRVDLEPGAEAEVEFALGRDELAFWNIDMKNVVEPGVLKIWIADDSRSGTPAEVTLQ